MPVKFNNSSKNTVSNSGIALFSFALDCHGGGVNSVSYQIILPFRLKYAVVAIVVDQFVYIFVLTPYFAGKEKTCDVIHVPAYFGTRPQDVNEVCDVDVGEITRELSAQVEHWNSRGSGFIIERVKNFVICIS